MNRTYTTAALLGSLALVAALAACGGGPEPAATNAPPPAPPANSNAAPPTAAPDVRPVALEGEALARTAKLYESTCATCHTKNGKGDPHHREDGIPDFTDRAWQTRETDAALREAITNGKGKVMPAFGKKLSGEQIDELVAYVRGFPDRPAPAAEAPGPMRHDDEATKPGSRKSDAPRTPPRKPAKPAPAKKDDHSGHGDHPNR